MHRMQKLLHLLISSVLFYYLNIQHMDIISSTNQPREVLKNKKDMNLEEQCDNGREELEEGI